MNLTLTVRADVLPVATTTITVTRTVTAEPVDPYDPPPPATVVHQGVRAHIGSPTGREQVEGGEQSVTDLRMSCDPIDLHHKDLVTDDTTGETFEVVWVKSRNGLGMDHAAAYLQHIEGAV